MCNADIQRNPHKSGKTNIFIGNRPLSPEPGASRTREVIVAQEILQTMGFRSFTPIVIACPGCGRTASDYFQRLAQAIQAYLREQMPVWKDKYKGVETMEVAVMGCVVNGPGESKNANIGISLPGSGESPVAPVFEDGVKTVTLKGDHIAEEFKALVERYIESHYGAQLMPAIVKALTISNSAIVMAMSGQ